MIDFILDELKNFDLTNIRAHAIEKGINDPQFIADFIQLSNYYDKLPPFSEENLKSVLEAQLHDPSMFKQFRTHDFLDFYQLFLRMINTKYNLLYKAQSFRHLMMSRCLRDIPFAALITKYDYYFHGAEGITLHSEEEITSLKVISNTLIVALISNTDLSIWNLKKSSKPKVFIDLVVQFHVIKSRPNHILVQTEDNLVRVIECENEEIISSVEINRSLDPLEIFPDGTRLAFLNDDILEIWNFETGELEHIFRGISNLNIVDNDRIVDIDMGYIKIFNIKKYIYGVKIGDGKIIDSITVLSDKKLLIEYTNDMKIWNLTTQQVDLVLPIYKNMLFKELPNNKLAIYNNNMLKIIDLNTGLTVFNNTDEKNIIYWVNSLPNNNLLVQMGHKSLFMLHTELQHKVIFDQEINNIKVFPNGTILVWLNDNILKIYG